MSTKPMSTESKILREAGQKVITLGPVAGTVGQEVSEAHKYGMIKAAIPVLHLLLLRREAVETTYAGTRITRMCMPEGSTQDELLRSLTRVLSRGYGGG